MNRETINKIVRRLEGDSLITFMKIMMNRDIEMEDNSFNKDARQIEDYWKEVKEWVLDGDDNEVSDKCTKIINFTPKHVRYDLK